MHQTDVYNYLRRPSSGVHHFRSISLNKIEMGRGVLFIKVHRKGVRSSNCRAKNISQKIKLELTKLQPKTSVINCFPFSIFLKSISLCFETIDEVVCEECANKTFMRVRPKSSKEQSLVNKNNVLYCQ